MTTHEAAVVWCAVQTAVIACLGAAATWLFARRAPAAGATAAAAAAGTILALTLLAPVPLPRVALLDAAPAEAEMVGEDAPRGGARAEVGAQPQAGGSVDLRGFAVWLGDAMRRVGERVKPRAAAERGGGWSWVLVVAIVGAAVGLVRLGTALVYVARLRRQCEPVQEGATVAMFAEIVRQLGVRRKVALCESTAITSPAVVGWRRPAVLLPPRHAAWTHEQLRAALAHELAHVVRGDFAWRAAASLATAVHFLHPLVHLLTRRFALMQELAADRLAAAAAGGSASYLRAISELAIRLDDSKELRVEPLVLPAFSSSLMRRIAMLRSKEGSKGHGRRTASGVAAAGLIALAGVATMALRGSAESVGPTASSPVESAALFARQPLDPAILRRPDAGVFIIRLAEMSERPALVPLVQLYSRCVQDGWKAVLGVEKAPEMHLEEIEYVAGASTMTWKAKTAEQKGQMIFSCEEFIIKFKRPVAWKSWTLTNVAGAEEVRDDAFEYVALPMSAWLGKLKFGMAARDEQTIVFSANVDRLRKLATGEPTAEPHAAAAKWAHLDGGLIAFLTPLKPTGEKAPAAEDSDPPLDSAALSGDPAAAVMQAICLNVQEFGCGFDLATATNDSGVRVCLTCADHAKADQLKKTLEARRLQAMTYLQAVNSGVNIAPIDEDTDPKMAPRSLDTVHEAIKWYFALLGSSTLQLEPRDDGQVDVRIEAQAKFPASVLQQYLARETKVDAAEVK